MTKWIGEFNQSISTESLKEKLRQYNQQITEEIQKTYAINYFQLNTGIYYLENPGIPPEQIISHTNIVRRKAKAMLSGVCEYTSDVALDEQRRADTLH